MFVYHYYMVTKDFNYHLQCTWLPVTMWRSSFSKR